MKSTDSGGVGSPTRVSVVMVTYNVAPFVVAALESVLAQRDADLEVIVGDDESSDGTWQLVMSVAKTDSRVRAFQQPHVGKPSVLRNAAMQLATGTHLTFLDGDDIYLPARISRTMAAFARVPGSEVVFHDVRRMAEDGVLKDDTYLTESNFLDRARLYWARTEGDTYVAGPRFSAFASAIFCPIHTSGITVTADRLRRETQWFPDDLVVGEDIDLWFRLVTDTSVVYLDAVLSAYRERQSSLTRDRRQFHAGTIEADLRNLHRMGARLNADERGYYVRRISRRYRFLATEHERAGVSSLARTCYYRSFCLEPNLEAVALGLKTLLPRPVKTLAQRLLRSQS